MAFVTVFYLLFVAAITTVDCNSEGDALHAWRLRLKDPNNVLQSWDPTLVNPCTWFHVTCNNQNSVTRVDLGNAGLSGPLFPQLGLLPNLQYFDVSSNSFSGAITMEIGNVKNLIGLYLQHNQLSGSIPASIGNLLSLRFLNLSSNKLSGTIPKEVIQLIGFGNLRIMNLTDNFFAGTVRAKNASEFRVTTIVRDPQAAPK